MVLSFSIGEGWAQDIKATAKLDTTSIRIGQQVKLQLSIHYRVDNGQQVKIHWPEIEDTLRKEVEVVGQSKIDTLIPDKTNPFQFVQTKTLLITSFDSGYWAIPPFKFIVNNDTTGVNTESLLLEVGTVAVDTALAIKDIKAPYQESYNWLDWIKDHMYVVYGTLIAILVTIVIIFLVRHFRKVPPPMVTIEAPKIPAHVIAFEKLDKLKNDKLWQEGKLKLYHSTLSEIVREYIENRFKIQALEQTTDEILFGFRNIAIDEESRMKLKQLLFLSDMVKFAKEQPLPNENEMSMNNAYDFINGTKREEELTSEQQAAINALKNQSDSVKIVCAGFGSRIIAHIIDSILISFFILITLLGIYLWPELLSYAATLIGLGEQGSDAYIIGGIVILNILGIIRWLYYAIMESSSVQATLGKKMIGLKVTDMHGNKISFGRASGRFFGKLLSAPLLIGYIMAAFTEKRQTLHDILSGCLVIARKN